MVGAGVKVGHFSGHCSHPGETAEICISVVVVVVVVVEKEVESVEVF